MTALEKDRLLVKDRLAERGIPCEDLHSLQKEPDALERAAPLLLELVSEVSSPGVRVDLVRVAAGANLPAEAFVTELRRLRPELERLPKRSRSLADLSGRALVAELARIRSESVESKGAASVGSDLADALRERADVTVFDELVEIVCDQGFGVARKPLPYALANVKPRRQDAIRTLLGLLGDEDVTTQAIDALAKMKALEAISAIQRCIDSEDQLVRAEARKALAALEKQSSRGEEEAPSPLRPPPAGTAEASTNFDLEKVPAFLNQLSSLVEGLSSSEIEHFESALLRMRPGEERSFDFRVRHRDDETPLQIRVYMSDVDAPDVGFFTSPKLAEVIDELMDELE